MCNKNPISNKFVSSSENDRLFIKIKGIIGRVTSHPNHSINIYYDAIIKHQEDEEDKKLIRERKNSREIHINIDDL